MSGGREREGMDLKGVTQDDLSKLTKAMKSAEFRSHMDEYTKEISDPANRKEYITYLDQLEAKGEMPDGQQLLRAQPGRCAKTTINFKNGQSQKCFINVVHCDRLDDMQMIREENGSGHSVKLPFSLAPPRPDRDHNDEYCMTCDFAVSTGTFAQALQNPQVMKMLIDTACDNLETHHLKGNESVKKDFKIMQRMNCKGGFPMPMSVRAELLKDKGSKPTTPTLAKGAVDSVTPSELKQMRSDAKDKRSKQEAADEAEFAALTKPAPPPPQEPAVARIRVPTHRLVHSGSIDLGDYMQKGEHDSVGPTSSVPKVLKLIVELPSVKRVSDVNLEVTSDNVVVEVPGKYYLDLPLSYEVQDSNGTAKFDKTKQVLTLELPVVPKPQTINPNAVVARDGVTVFGRGSAEDDDGALSEGAGSEDDLPALEERAAQQPVDNAPQAKPPVPVAPVETPAPVSEPPEPPRQRLEFATEERSSLHIAEKAPVPELLPSTDGDVVVLDAVDCPRFVGAESFTGARPGYYFGMGDEGLGYYVDSRQARPGKSNSRAVKMPFSSHGGAVGSTSVPTANDASSGALVSEVASPNEPVVRILPARAQLYVDTVSRLTTRVASSTVNKLARLTELTSNWQQNRQNLMLLINIPEHHGIADLQLRVTGQRVAVSFCLCEADDRSSESPWQRLQMRWNLCGAVDPRQWHAELTASSVGQQLVIIIRKSERMTMWEQIFDASVVASPEVIDGPGVASESNAVDQASASARGMDGLNSLDDDGASPSLEGSTAVADSNATNAMCQDDAQAQGDDSAELDAAAPQGEGAKEAARPVLKGTATDAMIQSATVMGQSVLLRNRVMYQLL